MLEISADIRNLDDSNIADNLLHYEYNVKHLLSLLKKGIDKEDPHYLSSYRSFEGEVYENYLYEKLIKYAEKNDYIDKFILKGFHQNRFKSFPNTLSISEKQQIVYRTKSREISEFDAMFLTIKNELYFVEMTLVKNVLKLRKRLRKKKALLEIVFPNYEIKALIILNDGATGAKQFPDYCTVWFTHEYSSVKVMQNIVKPRNNLKPKQKSRSKKMMEAHTLKLHPFRYYNTMSWITRTIRSHKKYIVDMNFLMNEKVQRYHNLFNKLYIGYLSIEEAKKILDLEGEYNEDQRVVVALEKKHSDEIAVTYYIQFTRKNLYYYFFNDENKQIKEKKDPYGITVTEVFHINKMMDNSYELNVQNIKTIKKLLRMKFNSLEKN